MRATSAATRLFGTFLKYGAGTGDRAFDRAWSFKVDDPDAVRRWLDPEVRAALTALRAAGLLVDINVVGLVTKGPLPSSDARPFAPSSHRNAACSMTVASTPFCGP